MAILVFVGAGFVSQVPGLSILGALGTGLFVVIGVILIGLAVLSFFVGRGLWKAQKWARIVAIIFSVVLVISGAIGGYLLFSKDVKAAFA